MAVLHMGRLEGKFADMIWENEPISSGKLSALAYDALNWKKTTAFTVLNRLCLKGIFRNDHGTVTSIIKKSEYNAIKSGEFVDDNFGGSLPAFVAAFTSQKKLSKEDVAELRRMVEEYEEK